ncbi:hypothetical protein GCM10007423_64080 [Dyadobacter endophyticus]|uniref:Uncharacterized protein n=2 Tax=Dyadobacter endophyticus TaxID=1749036 RepID=A0ABQ1ZD76_9BACT|nr:hypothetical protein GCM10007423_64080 [Dyadobacter endophyticus]
MLPPEIDESRINLITKAFFRRFAPSDMLPSPFRKDLFLLAGANLTYYRLDIAGSNKIFHFGCYDLDDPTRSVRFSLSPDLDADILNSITKFTEFIKNELGQARQDASLAYS